MTSQESSGYGLSAVPDETRIPAPQLDYLPATLDDTSLRIGLIGAGGISEYHLRAYQTLGLEVTAICDIDLDRAKGRRDAFYPQAAVTNRFEEIINRDDVDIIDAATHPDPRRQIMETAILAGKHVLSQKPFVTDLDLGQQLVELADQHRVVLAVNQNGRWAPHFRYMLSAIRAGVIGPVSSVDFTLQWDHTWTIDTPFNDIHHLLLYDFAIHWFDMACAMLAPKSPERVFASVQRSSFQRGQPPYLGQVAIDFDGAQVRMGFNAEVIYGQEDRTVVAGQRGTLRADGPSLNEQRVRLWTEAGTSEAVLSGCWFDNGFQGTVAELIRAIQEDRPPENSARQNLESLALCFAAITSANSGQPIKCGSVRQLPMD